MRWGFAICWTDGGRFIIRYTVSYFVLFLYRGLYFGPKTIFIPPPFWKWYFFPLSRHVVFRHPFLPFCLFALILPYFAFIWPFYFPFSHFLFPFSFFFPLSSFSFTLSPFLFFAFSFFFPQMTSADIPPLGGDISWFPPYRPKKFTYSFKKKFQCPLNIFVISGAKCPKSWPINSYHFSAVETSWHSPVN
jgi:hypothetical protein